MPTLWPFIPEGVVETLGFLTDVLGAYSAEQRIQLRQGPRQSITLQWRPEEPELAAADALYRSNPAGEWYVPYWPDSIYAGAISAGATTVSVDASNRDYRAGGFVAIVEGYNVAEVVSLTSVGSGVLNLGGSVAGTYTAAFLVPVLTGYCIGGLSFLREAERHLSLEISFTARSYTSIGATTYDQYNSLDVLHDRSYVIDSLPGAAIQAISTIDPVIGGAGLELLESYLRGRSSIQFEDDGAARWTRRKWLYNIAGRKNAFWLPTWNADFSLQSTIGASDTSMTVTDFPGIASIGGRSVMFELTDGTRYYRPISTISEGTPNSSVGFTTALGQSVAPSDVKVICFLNKVRSDADAIRILHEGNNRSSFMVPTIEVAA